MLLVLIACSCATIVKASVVLLKHLFFSHPHQSSLALPIVCLINCPCNCFCVHCFSFHSFTSFCTRLMFLYGHFILLYMQQLTISLCCFLHNFLTQKLLSPQYLELQSILCRFHFLIDTKCVYLGWNSLCLVSNFLALLSISSS